MIKFEEIAPRLAGIRKNRKWLAQQIGQSENTVRQYLGPNGKRSPEFLKKVENVILAEELIQKERQPDAPPWNLIFLTDEQFDRADRASRKKGYLSLKDFCREAILESGSDPVEIETFDLPDRSSLRRQVAESRRGRGLLSRFSLTAGDRRRRVRASRCGWI